jgi:hypothetical protein
VPTFNVRYKLGQGPADADEDDVIAVDAATFVTIGNFVDFYSRASESMDGVLIPKGNVVFRVHQDVIADIREA